VLTEISTLIPAGVVLNELSAALDTFEEADNEIWSLRAAGAVIDPGLRPTILTEMEAGMEASELFRDVRVSPLGSTTLDINGSKINGAILFEVDLCME
jgi:hypothetical protein